MPPTSIPQDPPVPIPTEPEPLPRPTPTRDLTGLFAPAVLAWLGRRGCDGVRWADPAEAATGARARLEFAVDIGSAPLATTRLHLVSATVAALAQADEAAVRAYLAALQPFLREGPPAPAEPAVALSQETRLAMEHRVRNHLNSMLMTAAALSLKCEGQDGVDVYLDQMELDSRHCLELLHRLAGAA